MDPVEAYQDVLQNIESVVVAEWRKDRTMTNYTAMRAYDAAIAHYHALAQQRAPKPANLSGGDAAVFNAVKAICDWRAGVAKSSSGAEVEPLPLEDLVACLRKLRKSVDFWTKMGGRQGYLDYIEKFLP